MTDAELEEWQGEAERSLADRWGATDEATHARRVIELVAEVRRLRPKPEPTYEELQRSVEEFRKNIDWKELEEVRRIKAARTAEKRANRGPTGSDFGKKNEED